MKHIQNFLTSLSLILNFVTSMNPTEYGYPLEKNEGLQNLLNLTEEEICDAICMVPIKSRVYHAYRMEMLVLKHVYSGLLYQRTALNQMLSDLDYCSAQAREDFEDLSKAFGILTYAFQGVNFTFTANFDVLATRYGLDSPIAVENQILDVSVEINGLQRQWLLRYYRTNQN